MMVRRSATLVAAVTALVAVSIARSAAVARADEPADDPSRWDAAIAAFEKQDKQSAPQRGGVVFVGSSSIRLWNLQKHFPEQTALNRGFGGSHLSDSVHFADRLVLKHLPRIVVLYAGDNDLWAGKTPERVHRDFCAFVQTIHAALPETRIVFLPIKPSLARWKIVETVRATNRLIEAECARDERLVYADLFGPMLGDDGRPRSELFVNDRLHLSEAGYALWSERVRPLLDSNE